jgi:nitroimidazol reductase NimA-like FMN-containing flavoprotein (pyridoxamine 5'-phosphate oxidase superfamily)
MTEVVMAITPGVNSMNETEVTDFLKDSRCGILTLVDGDKPYPVPLEHYFDGKNLYFMTSKRPEHRKISCIMNNGNASYVISDSRREKPELFKQGIPCRSVIVEGKISLAGIKETDTKEWGRVRVQMLKLETEQISNWKCPRKTCDWPTPWFDRYPNLLADL